MLLVVMAFAIVGARLYHVIHMWDHYIANPIESRRSGTAASAFLAGSPVGRWASWSTPARAA